ncbi:M1 family metallopeptidase [Streptomyces sp. NBC_00239]|uniref:M1 family metallopeptidase n=1 Tax=Streptomyces sp. NBC_00239 TaxID=2903640 RepID=UPI002E2DCB5F|nr:M1 family metallopeptidase [Streptomyces sp. NBC_00239]
MRRTGHSIAAMALAALMGVAGLGAPASADAGSGTERVAEGPAGRAPAGTAEGTAAGTAVGAAPSAPAYRVALRADDTGTRWTGRETVTFGNRSATPLREVYVRLWGNGTDGCGTAQAPSPVRIGRVTGGTRGALSVGCTAVRIALPAPLPPGGRATVGFDVSITVPDRMHRFGRDGAHRYLGNALPVLAVRDGRGWHLDPHVDSGESYYTLASDFRVTLDHPAALKVPATGVTTTRPGAPGHTVTTSVARRVRDFAWAAGPFRSGVATSPGGVTVRSYWTAGTPDAWVAASRAEAVRAIDGLGKRFGRYPYGEVDAVISDRFAPIGSMEYPGLVLVWADETGSGTAHELAHQWWYGIVGNDEYASPWLDEAFATYSADLLNGDDGAYCADIVSWEDDTQAVTNPMGYWAAYGRGWHRFVYFNGGCALHDLEKVLGAPAMAAMLKRYARDHWYGVSTTTAFQRAAQAATPTDLTSFWREHRIRTEKTS